MNAQNLSIYTVLHSFYTPPPRPRITLGHRLPQDHRCGVFRSRRAQEAEANQPKTHVAVRYRLLMAGGLDTNPALPGREFQVRMPPLTFTFISMTPFGANHMPCPTALHVHSTIRITRAVPHGTLFSGCLYQSVCIWHVPAWAVVSFLSYTTAGDCGHRCEDAAGWLRPWFASSAQCWQ
jgi:hypothetical protein